MNRDLRMALEDETDWEPALLNHKQIEVCAIDHRVLGQKKYRPIVAYRTKAIGQLTIDHRDGYDYHAVITNDQGDSHRGYEGEHHFKGLDYDFGWRTLPFDSMEMNAIYMYATIIAYHKQLYAAKLSFINPQMRLKNFTLHFVTLVSK